MNYHCHTPFEGDKCPVCGSRNVRPIQEEDLCTVMEGDAVVTGMLGDALKQEEIPFLRQSLTGAAMAMLLGRQLEQFEVLVPYGVYSQGRQIVDDLFSNPVEAEYDPAEDEDRTGEWEEEDDED